MGIRLITIVVGSLALLATTPSSAVADAGLYPMITTNQLLNLCQTDKETCRSRIFEVQAYVEGESGELLCTNKNGPSEIAQEVVDWLRAHPENRKDDSQLSVTDALFALFSCPK